MNLIRDHIQKNCCDFLFGSIFDVEAPRIYQEIHVSFEEQLVGPPQSQDIERSALVTAGLPKLRDEKEAVGGMRVIV